MSDAVISGIKKIIADVKTLRKYGVGDYRKQFFDRKCLNLKIVQLLIFSFIEGYCMFLTCSKTLSVKENNYLVVIK